MRKAFAKHQGCRMDEVGKLPTLISGGVSGLACWFLAYPLDIIKCKLQVEN